MTTLQLLNIAALGFAVSSIFIIHNDVKKFLLQFRIQQQNNWNAIVQNRTEIRSMHDRYAKLYTRVCELEKLHEVHSRDSG